MVMVSLHSNRILSKTVVDRLFASIADSLFGLIRKMPVITNKGGAGEISHVVRCFAAHYEKLSSKSRIQVRKKKARHCGGSHLQSQSWDIMWNFLLCAVITMDT